MDRIDNIARFPARSQHKPIKVVAVTGGKGGVGKSAICANVALSLASMGRRVLLLDGDLGLANAHLMLGVRPRFTLRQVVRGECELDKAICDGPGGLKLLAGANGFIDMARLCVSEHAGIINCLSAYEQQLDVLMVDTAPGISDSVLQFAGAASTAMVVVRDEPASITDAYSIIKILNTEKRVAHFDVVTNMTSAERGARVFNHLQKTVDRFMTATLSHTGNVPADDKVLRAIRSKRPVLTAFPRSSASKSLHRLARRIDGMPPPANASGRLEFFGDRLFAGLQAEAGYREIAS
jgi:flagellar biosynthesis protein FlhG